MKTLILALLLSATTAGAADIDQLITKDDDRNENILLAANEEIDPAQDAQADKDASKFQKLFSLKDQSSVAYFEQKYAFGGAIGASQIIAEPPGSEFGTKDYGTTVALGLDYYASPEFSFGGFFQSTQYIKDDFFAQKTNFLNLGMQAAYHIGNFYIGSRTGFGFAKIAGSLKTDFFLGPYLGFNFRINESLSITPELQALMTFHSPTSFTTTQMAVGLQYWY